MDGGQAVKLFFVLSGFLITLLLLREQRETGTINVGQFYRRRALRILPLYYLILSIGVLLPLLLPSPLWKPVPGTYVLGFALMLGNVVSVQTSFILILGVLWTISLEEWFYAVWGFVVRNGWLVKACIGILAVRFLSHLVVPFLGDSLFLRVWGSLQFENMAVGALGALLYLQYPKYFRWLTRPTLLPLVIAVMLLLAVWTPNGDAFTNTLMASFYLVLIAQVITRPGILESRPLKWVGQRSYGVYMWHNVLMALCAIIGLGVGMTLICVLVGVLLVAHLSYTYFEQPFLRFKERFATGVQSTAA
jgi:peptidoglycan/LPS O-acetylase OafA/YrhL